MACVVLGAEFVIFQAHQDLAFFDLVALFHADPLHPAGHFGIQVDLVVGHNVAAGGEHDAAHVAALRRRAHHFHFRRVVREQAIGDRNNSQQHQHRDPDEDVAAGPDWRFALATGARRAINSQAAQVFVFCVNRHICVAPASRRLSVGVRHPSLSALNISRREACHAGANPPTTPMIRANMTALMTTAGVICRLNTTSLNVT